jgi:putative membrane protein
MTSTPRIWTLLAATAATMALPGLAQAQRWPGTPLVAQQDASVALHRLGLTDQSFLRAVANAVHAQAELGSLAEDRGSSPEVRELARRVTHRQHRLGFELSQLALQEQLPLPAAKPPAQQPCYVWLEALSGEAFDRAFLDAERVALTEEAELLQTEATSGTHPSLRAFAERNRPALLADAKETESGARSRPLLAQACSRTL